MRKKIVAGNWKMNMNKAEANDLFNNINGFEIPPVKKNKNES